MIDYPFSWVSVLFLRLLENDGDDRDEEEMMGDI